MSTKYVAGIQGGDQVPTFVGHNDVQMAPFNNPTFIAGDTLVIGPIPGGAMLTGFFIDLPQLDTGTSLTVDVGTDLTTGNQGTGTNGIIALSTVGRSSTVNVLSPGNNAFYVHGSIPFVYVPLASAITTGVLPVVCNLLMTIHTAAQTATTTGTIYAYYSYQMIDNANATHKWL
jgi:hypothetical protein